MNIDFSKVNFEGVLVGALSGLLLKTLLDRILIAQKLNRQRKVILDYSKYIGLDKSSKYLQDLDFVKKYVLAEEENEIQEIQESNYSIDAMPSFTSSIFKSFSQDELRRVSFTSSNYIRILDISYSIDFLREYMPLELWDKYQIKVRKHFEDEKIEDEIKHFKECGYLKKLAGQAVNEIEMKRERAVMTHAQFHILIEELNGWSIFWLLGYFIRQ
jgi:hypothetical protein